MYSLQNTSVESIGFIMSKRTENVGCSGNRTGYRHISERKQRALRDKHRRLIGSYIINDIELWRDMIINRDPLLDMFEVPLSFAIDRRPEWESVKLKYLLRTQLEARNLQHSIGVQDSVNLISMALNTDRNIDLFDFDGDGILSELFEEPSGDCGVRPIGDGQDGRRPLPGLLPNKQTLQQHVVYLMKRLDLCGVEYPTGYSLKRDDGDDWRTNQSYHVVSDLDVEKIPDDSCTIMCDMPQVILDVVADNNDDFAHRLSLFAVHTSCDHIDRRDYRTSRQRRKSTFRLSCYEEGFLSESRSRIFDVDVDDFPIVRGKIGARLVREALLTDWMTVTGSVMDEPFRCGPEIRYRLVGESVREECPQSMRFKGMIP